MLRIAFALVCFQIISVTSAQDWQPVENAEVIKARDESALLYARKDKFAMQLELASFASPVDTEPVEKVNAQFKKMGLHYRSEIGGVVTIQDEQLRLVMDPDEGIHVLDPIDLQDVMMMESSNMIIERLSKCSKRLVGDMVEYRLQFAKGAEYDHTILRFDKNGFLRKTITVWRKGVQEDPLMKGSKVYFPRIEIDYSLPVPLTTGETLDPWKFIQQTSEGLMPIGDWKNKALTDLRYRP